MFSAGFCLWVYSVHFCSCMSLIAKIHSCLACSTPCSKFISYFGMDFWVCASQILSSKGFMCVMQNHNCHAFFSVYKLSNACLIYTVHFSLAVAYANLKANMWAFMVWCTHSVGKAFLNTMLTFCVDTLVQNHISYFCWQIQILNKIACVKFIRIPVHCHVSPVMCL